MNLFLTFRLVSSAKSVNGEMNFELWSRDEKILELHQVFKSYNTDLVLID